MSDYGDEDDGGYVEEAYEEYQEEREEEEEEEEEQEEEEEEEEDEEEEEEEHGSGSEHSEHEEHEDRAYYEQENPSEREYYSGGAPIGQYTRGYGEDGGYPGQYSAEYSGDHGGGYGGDHSNALAGALGGGLLGGVLGAAASRLGRSSGGGHETYQSHESYQSHDNYQSHGNYSQDHRGSTPHAPPEGKVQFGHGAPAEYAYSYSNCTGKRKALLVGINYFGQSGQLSGCINDVHNVSSYLIENFGYARKDMVILTDDQQDPSGQPTKANVLRAMQWLVAGAQPNDSLFFHYSGHGGSTKDLNGDEEDGNDEVIYPVDYTTAGHIVDDDMHTILVNPLQAGVRLTCIFDSCHSGSALDLPYMYSTSGVVKEPNLAKEAGQGLLDVFTSANSGDYGGAATHVFNFFKKASISDDAREKTVQTKTSPADVIMWSGSKDDQTSADATINDKATGAMSWAFIGAMRKNPQQSYVQLLNSIREVLATKYTQKPQLSSSHPIDTDLLFIM